MTNLVTEKRADTVGRSAGQGPGREAGEATPLEAAAELVQARDPQRRLVLARRLAETAAERPAEVAPAVPHLLAALIAWDDPETNAALRGALEAVGHWSLKPLRGEVETLRRALFDPHSAGARAYAAQTLARLMVADRALKPEIWSDLAAAVERQASSHQVDGMLEGIRLLAVSALARPLTVPIRELTLPFVDHWKPQVQFTARTILHELERTQVLPPYLRSVKGPLGLSAPQPPPVEIDPATLAATGYVSLRDVNRLPQVEQVKFYRRLLPKRLLAHYAIDDETLRDAQGDPALRLLTDVDAAMVEMTLWRARTDIDPALLLNFGETTNGQIQIYLVVINNLDAERFGIDYDAEGRPTLLGLAHRNLVEEERAMAAGLAPGQVRAGLGMVARRLLPAAEQFTTDCGKQYIFAQPLAYHNAILLESWGFSYLTGQRFMETLHSRFMDGDLRAALDGSPFRPPAAWQTVRGRSWAIHDGILGEPWPELHMIKRVGQAANVHTFPEGAF